MWVPRPFPLSHTAPVFLTGEQMTTIKLTSTIKAQILRVIKKTEEPEEPRIYLSTGSTLLNLALTDRVDGGFLAGKYYYLVGDSSSGKTFLSMTCFAEATRNPHFKKHRLIYDNIEDGMLMNVRRLFGREVEKRLEPPAMVKGEPVFSSTVEDFYYRMDDLFKEGKPFIYVLDSMDGLESEDDAEHFDKSKKAHRAGKEGPGSYGMAKAKKNSQGLRRLIDGLRKTGSILIIISQTRDNPNAMGPWVSKKTRSGGKALRFYACGEVWSSITGSVTKDVRGIKRKVGTEIKLQVVKNRTTGKLHDVEMAIFPSYGIDDLGSCVDYLVTEKWWKKTKGFIEAPEVSEGERWRRDDLIKTLEDTPRALRKAMRVCWRTVEKAKALERRPRYE